MIVLDIMGMQAGASTVTKPVDRVAAFVYNPGLRCSGVAQSVEQAAVNR
jgi:hypothetical protein